MYNNTTIPSSFYVSAAERYFNTIFLSIVMAVAIVGNSIALHAFFVSPQLKKITYYFIASLCVSDILVAIVLVPIWIINTQLGWALSENWNIFYACLDIFCSTLSIMSLAMISIERYICIKYALQYFNVMTSKRGYFMIIFIIIYSLVTSVINYCSISNAKDEPSTYITLQMVIVILAYLVPVFIKLFTYTKIVIEAKKQSKLIKGQMHNYIPAPISENELSKEEFDVNENGVEDDKHRNLIITSSSTHNKNKVSQTVTDVDEISSINEERNYNNITFDGNKLSGNDLYCEFDPRKRAVSCPENYKINRFKKPRQSIDPSGMLNRNKKEIIYDSICSKINESPLLHRLLLSKWSPVGLRKFTNTPKQQRKHHESKVKRFKRELRATKVVGLIMGTFLFCWTPFIILVIITTLNRTFHNSTLTILSKDLHYLNSAINPILYVVLNRVYRNAVLKALERLKNKLNC